MVKWMGNSNISGFLGTEVAGQLEISGFPVSVLGMNEAWEFRRVAPWQPVLQIGLVF